MLTAVPDLTPQAAWVQVLGRVAVHFEDGEAHRLTGSGQRLLSVLVAAGPDGATAERIAEEIWGDEQPNPWRPALRMAVARLRKQLPPEWDVVSDGGFYRITTHTGWIDAWRLEEIASAKEHIIESDLAWMLAGQPFGDIDLLEMVTASTQNLQMLQIAVAERFCSQGPEAATTTTCAVLGGLVRDHPYNDRLAVVVARALAGAGRRTEALMSLTAFADAYSSEFGAVPSDVANFLATGGEAEPLADEPDEIVQLQDPEVFELPKELRYLSEVPLLGRKAEFDMLRNARGALVTGATGSGKSRLLAALIASDDNTETVYVVGDDRLDLPLGPFAVAMPRLRDELLASALDDGSAGRDDGSIERAASTRAWRIVLAHLEARSTTRPQRLVVDDAHLLDPASFGLLRLLIRSNTAADLTFIVCGRSDFDDVEWTDLVRDAERAGLDPIELKGLDLSVLEEMVYGQFPTATHHARQGLARDVLEASGGLPAVAGPLVASADPVTLALPEVLAGASALARVTGALSAKAPEVVAAAAVLGHQFSIGALIALTELDESSIFGVLDELWATGLIVETDDPDQVRFRHVLIQRAFLEGVPLFRRGQLHRRAAELSIDPHQRADHQANASALVPAEVAAASLLESAMIFASKRQWRKVARELRRADALPGEHLDAKAMTMWAEALDKSGSDGSIHRRRGFQLAADGQDWEAALDAAISGLPEAERPDGDVERIEMLDAIPNDGLPEHRRFDRVFHLSRQYALFGGANEKVLQHAAEALELASDADQVSLSHVCRWMGTRHFAAEIEPIPLEIVHQGSPRVRMRLAQINAITLAEAGNFADARLEAERFSQLAADRGDPLRIWHARGLKSMFMLNDGSFDEAEAYALETLKFADLHDMQQGAATYIGLRVYSYDNQDRLDELKPVLEPFRANLSTALLGRAALALADEASTGRDIGPDVRGILEDARRRLSTFSLLSTVILARYVLQHAPELRDEISDLLSPYKQRPLLAGFGAGSFGPTSRYLAQLAADPDEKLSILAGAIDAADEHGPLLWRVRTRLDAADLGSMQALDEATALASGTGLEATVSRRAKHLR